MAIILPFKEITTQRLVLLLLVFLIGTSFILLPADPASHDLYLLLALLTGCFILLTTVAAATILVYVTMAVSSAEDKVDAARRRKLTLLLLLATGLSATSTFVADFNLEAAILYHKEGTSVILGRPARWLLYIIALEHGISFGYLMIAAVFEE